MADEEQTEVTKGLEEVAQAAEQVSAAATTAAKAAMPSFGPTLDHILDLPLQVTVEVGRSKMTIQDLLQLGAGSVVELEKLAGESLDVYINGKKVAKGEAVIVNEKFGVRLLDVVSKEARAEGLK